MGGCWALLGSLTVTWAVESSDEDMGDAHRQCWGLALFMMAWSCCWVGVGTSGLSLAVGVQGGDSILLSVLVKVSVLVARILLLVVTVSLLGGDQGLDVPSEETTK